MAVLPPVKKRGASKVSATWGSMDGRKVTRVPAPFWGRERRLWQGLRREQVAGFRFRREVVLGGFIAGFACLEARMIVAVDGATHSADEEIARDAARSAALRALGFDVLRSPTTTCSAISRACWRRSA
jgi:very-short-patch-repair endonuclease